MPDRAAKQRVVNLLNAISNLRRGDLLYVLSVVSTNDDMSDEQTAQLLEKHLMWVMAQGEAELICYPKSRNDDLVQRPQMDELGGFEFRVDD